MQMDQNCFSIKGLGVSTFVAYVTTDDGSGTECSDYDPVVKAYNAIEFLNATCGEACVSQLNNINGGEFYANYAQEFFEFLAKNIRPQQVCSAQRAFCGYLNNFDPKLSSAFNYIPSNSTPGDVFTYAKAPPAFSLGNGQNCNLDGSTDASGGGGNSEGDDGGSNESSASAYESPLCGAVLVGIISFFFGIDLL